MISPKQVDGLENLFERVSQLEAENKAHYCILKGLLVKHLGASIRDGAIQAADKLPDADRVQVRELIDSLLQRDS